MSGYLDGGCGVFAGDEEDGSDALEHDAVGAHTAHATYQSIKAN